MATSSAAVTKTERHSVWTVLLAFLRLGLTSFGGPIAHLGYFRIEFVERRKWLDEATFIDIVALCQLLPGPASSQVGMVLGILRAGLPGALAAWLGFTIPSAFALILFGYGIGEIGDLGNAAWLHGLKIVAVAVVAQAVWGMARSLCPDRERVSLAVAAAVLALAVPSAAGQIGAIILGGLIGWRLLPGTAGETGRALALPVSKTVSIAALAAFAALLILLPLLARATGDHTIQLFDSFYRAGSLVFGGGHVVLPLLHSQVVPPGWVANDAFLAGYGAAQAIPGPLSTFAAYLGTVMGPPPHGWLGGVICLVAIFLPSFLLVIGALPFWEMFRRQAGMRSALKGISAAVVGLLLAALYTPVWTSAILAPADFAIALVIFLLLAFWKLPPWLIVILGAFAAEAAARLL
ncbi:MAG: chromate transporter [Rhodospirillaceae bacterium]|nr:chromate transporter [Rhodospirillaceae bacterium]